MQTRDTDKDWNELAVQDAYYAVLSHPRFSHAEQNPEALKEFFDSGVTWIDNVVGAIRKRLNPAFAPEIGLDFGCGVGRLMVPMAQYCKSVIGIDIADRMRDHCDENLKSRRVRNFVLLKRVSELAERNIQVDWINSYIVFQHIPPLETLELLNGMLAQLREAGAISIHITFAKDSRMLEWSTRQVRYYRMSENGLQIIEEQPGPTEAVQSIYDHDMNAVLMTLFRHGIRQTFMVHEDHGGQHGALIYGLKGQ